MPNTLTEAFVKNIKSPGRYTDASTRGLNLQVKASGGKYWTFRHVTEGKRIDTSLGAYPSVSLREARAKATDLRAQLNRGEPILAKRRLETFTAAKFEAKVLFKDFATDCIAAKRSEWRNPKHAAQWTSTVERFANPVIGEKALQDITMDDILKILSPIWHIKTVTAERLRGRLEWIFASAITRKIYNGANPASWRGLLETILPKPGKIKKEVHHSALPYKDIPAFLEKLREVDGIAPLALEFLILNASRTGEVIGGCRSEVNEDNIWIIPGERMKSGREHRVPLGKRSQELLEISKSLDPDSDYLFSQQGKPLSNMAMLMAIRRMGYKVTAHGFRSCFRDWVSEETNHSSEVAEKALAHTIANKVEAAYRRGDLLEPRRRLMLDWESFCLTGAWGNVIAIDTRLAA